MASRIVRIRQLQTPSRSFLDELKMAIIVHSVHLRLGAKYRSKSRPWFQNSRESTIVQQVMFRNLLQENVLGKICSATRLKSQFIDCAPKTIIYAGDASINTMVFPVYTLGRKKTIAEKCNQTYHQIGRQSFEDDEFAQAKRCVGNIRKEAAAFIQPLFSRLRRDRNL